MKYWIPLDWSDSFEHEGLLFFVQRIQEMLFHFSSDVHRAPVHNTSTLIHEFLSTYNEVSTGEVKDYHLKPIFDELAQSFSCDKVLYENLGESFISTVYSHMRSCSMPQYHDMVSYLDSIISPNYYRWTIDYLKKHIPMGKHKNEIDKGSRAWVADTIMRGYSAEFIYFYIEHYLIKRCISTLDEAYNFFERFDSIQRPHKVYFQISKSMQPYFQLLTDRLSLSFENDGFFHLIRPAKNYIICYFIIDAYDFYSALSLAYKKINTFCKFYRFISNKRNYLLYKFGSVRECDDEKVYHLPIVPTGFKSIEILQENVSGELLDNIIWGLVNNRYQKDVAQINKAIELHNSAIRQVYPKDGFVNLWSILEVLCPQGESSSKLIPILQAILPIMQNDYYTTIFDSILTDMMDNLATEDLESLKEKVEFDSIYPKIAALCFLPAYEQLREDCFSEWSNFPLLRYKIYSLYVLRENKKEIFQLSKNYRQRVEWHLYRLYRTRNKIVHGGMEPKRTRVLGEHLHSYVDSIVYEVAYKLSQYEDFTSINNIFVDTSFLIKYKEQHFHADGCLTHDDIDILFRDRFPHK